jgi:hypothetical protein
MAEAERTKVRWASCHRRLPNAFELYSLLLAGGALWYVPRALKRPVPPGEPAFVGPFKGGTRAIGCLLRGDLVEAVTYNPLAVVLAALLLAGVARWLLIVLPLGRRPLLELNQRGRWIALALALLVFASGWAYVVLSESWRRPWAG